MARSIMNRVQGMLFGILKAYQPILPTFPALLGDGHGTIPIGTHPGFVYIRMGAEGEDGLSVAFNQVAPLRDGLSITVGYKPEQPRLFQVICQREAYVGTGQSIVPSVVAHAPTHEYPTLGDPDADGSDTGHWHWRQIRGLRTLIVSGFTVKLEQWHLRRGSVYKWISTQQLDLTTDKPATGARYVLTYIDAVGVFQKRLGDIVPTSSLDLELHCPGSSSGEWVSAAVRLYGSQTQLQEDQELQDIVDLRFPEAFSAGGVVWDNVLTVAKAGGQYDTVAGALAVAVAGDVVAVMPGDFAENVEVGTDDTGLTAAFGMSWHTRLTGSDDDGPVVDITGQNSLVGMVVFRALGATGSGEYILVDASETDKYPSLRHNFINLDGNSQGRVVTALKLSGTATTAGGVSHSWIKAENGAAGSSAVKLDGGLVHILWCRITGDVICSAATDVSIVGTTIDGDLTGMSGATLTLQNTYVSGVISGWDTVTYNDQMSIGGQAIADIAPSAGQVLTWDAVSESWKPEASAGGGPGGTITEATSPRWHADGPVAIADEIDGVWVLAQNYRIETVRLYVGDTGDAGTDTIADVEKSSDGISWTTLFSTQADRPTVVGGAASGLDTATPTTVQELPAGTLLRMNLESVAVGARNVSVQLGGEAGSEIGLGDLTTLGCG